MILAVRGVRIESFWLSMGSICGISRFGFGLGSFFRMTQFWTGHENWVSLGSFLGSIFQKGRKH